MGTGCPEVGSCPGLWLRVVLREPERLFGIRLGVPGGGELGLAKEKNSKRSSFPFYFFSSSRPNRGVLLVLRDEKRETQRRLYPQRCGWKTSAGANERGVGPASLTGAKLQSSYSSSSSSSIHSLPPGKVLTHSVISAALGEIRFLRLSLES